MKLVSCHIENFGKLHDYSADFSSGINVICEENGWGKSTFAAFIRAMFYGLEGERKRSLQENERKRYKPWQGGIFGGQLVFEIDGKTYQITRIFQDKEANDTFELRDAITNLPSKDYSKSIGEELFRINRESFLRTVFITQSECETAATDDINAKIGHLSDHTHDLNHFDTASARLTEILNALTPRRVSGSLSKRKEEIAAYERLVQGGQEISTSIDTYQQYLCLEQDHYETLKREVKEAGQEQKKILEQHAAAAKKAEWNRLKKAVLVRKEETAQVRQNLSGRLLTAQELRNQISICGEMERAQERISSCRLTPEAAAELRCLSEVFSDAIPKDVDSKIKEASRLQEMEQELKAVQLTEAEQERLNKLKIQFAHEQEALPELVKAWSQRSSKKEALSSNQAVLAALQAAQKQRTKRISPLAGVGIGMVLIGAAAAFAIKISIGVILAAVGGVLLLMGLLSNQRKASGSAELEQLRQQMEEDQAFILRIDRRVAAYLNRHGMAFEETSVEAMLQELTMVSLEYASLSQKKEKAADAAKGTEIEEMRCGLTSFLRSYGAAVPEGSMVDVLYTLKEEASRYQLLQDQQDRFRKAEKAYGTYHEALTGFLKENGYQPQANLLQQLNMLQELTSRYGMAVKLQGEAEAALGQFEEAQDLALLLKAPEKEALPSLEKASEQVLHLTDQMQEVHKTIAGYRKALEDLREKQEDWEEKGVYLQELKSLQLAEQKKYRAVSMAKEKLTMAKEAMTARYADPIRRSFSRYYEKISGESAESFYVDANTAVTVQEFGKQREAAALSTGYRDLVGICLRIALVDAMYQEETPVLIMDDPFVNLDDVKNAAAGEFVKEIAKKYQVIYFTCSQRRSGR